MRCIFIQVIKIFIKTKNRFAVSSQRGQFACDLEWHSIESSGDALRQTPEEDSFKNQSSEIYD